MISHKRTAIRWALASAILSGAGFLAEAAERPPLAPTRDVVVAYQVEMSQAASGGPAQGEHAVKMSYSAASGRARIDQAPGSGAMMPGYLLIDRAGGKMTLVMDQMQTFMDMPFDANAGAGLLLNDRMGFVRGGGDRVAGLACTQWTVTSDRTTAHLCITDDGVILRGDGRDPKRGEAKLLATAVTYASQPAAKFVPPPGFRYLDMHGLDMRALPGLGGKLGKFPG
jgi:hypothetical protein